MVFYRLDGQPLECNSALLKLLGESGDAADSLSAQRLGWRGEEWGEVLKECLQTGYSQPREREIRHPDGSSVHVEAIAHLRRDGDGTPGGVWEILHDITQRKMAEAQLLLSAEAFARHADGVLLTDADEQILTANDAFTSACGYSREELRGRTPVLFKSGKHNERFYARMRRDIHQNGWWQGGSGIAASLVSCFSSG